MGCPHTINFVEVRDPDTGKLLFRFDPIADVIEVKPKGGNAVKVSLAGYREQVERKQ